MLKKFICFIGYIILLSYARMFQMLDEKSFMLRVTAEILTNIVTYSLHFTETKTKKVIWKKKKKAE